MLKKCHIQRKTISMLPIPHVYSYLGPPPCKKKSETPCQNNQNMSNPPPPILQPWAELFPNYYNMSNTFCCSSYLFISISAVCVYKLRPIIGQEVKATIKKILIFANRGGWYAFFLCNRIKQQQKNNIRPKYIYVYLFTTSLKDLRCSVSLDSNLFLFRKKKPDINHIHHTS